MIDGIVLRVNTVAELPESMGAYQMRSAPLVRGVLDECIATPADVAMPNDGPIIEVDLSDFPRVRGVTKRA